MSTETPASGEGQVRYELRDGIGWVTFDNPRLRNAMTFGMYERLAEIAREVNEGVPGVEGGPFGPQGPLPLPLRGTGGRAKALVLTGVGEAFVAGTDISQFREFTSERHAVEYEERMDRVLGALEDVRVPTIAAIGGAATGGGLAIAAACDLRVASPGATFGMPIARTLGNCLSIGNLVRLASLVGAAKVKELIFTARLIDAPEAARIGLIHEVVSDAGALLGRAEELARQVSSHAPLTLWATKEGLRRIRRRLLPEEGRDLVVLCYTSRDFREGVAAFMERRRPEWHGD